MTYKINNQVIYFFSREIKIGDKYLPNWPLESSELVYEGAHVGLYAFAHKKGFTVKMSPHCSRQYTNASGISHQKREIHLYIWYAEKGGR